MVLSRSFGMLPTINLNNQSLFQTDKVTNIISNWYLSAEFVPVNLSQPKLSPESFFSAG